MEAGNEIYLKVAPSQFSKELSSRDSYLEVSKNQFYEIDRDPAKLFIDRIHHVEEDNVHHVEEDTVHHLEESDGETSDDENEDFCHLIDFNTRLPPEWERKRNPQTNMIEYYDHLTNQWEKTKPRILERFEVFDVCK